MSFKQQGVTFLELLITISITLILVTIAVPSFSDLIKRSRISGVTGELMAALNLARSEAIRRGQSVSVCKSSDGASCGGTNWDSGWIVFINEDNDSPAAVDNGETILRVRQDLPQGITVRPNSNFANYLTFSRTGLANSLGTFAICVDSDESTAKAITVIRTRASIATDGDGNGIPEKVDDDELADIGSCENP